MMQVPARTARRRMAGAMVSSVALHALLLLLPFSWFLRHGTSAGSGPPGESPSRMAGSFFASALHGSDVTVLIPQAAVVLETPTEPVQEDPSKEEVEEIKSEMTRDQPPLETSGSTAPGDEGTPGGTGGPGSGQGVGAGAAGTGTDPTAAPEPPGEVAIRPREYVHPRIPEEVVRKRKISDFVLMQVLVGTDGSVRNVRVLRAIANCEECNQSAVDAAWRLRYDPVMVAGRATEVWTVPFDFKFSYQR